MQIFALEVFDERHHCGGLVLHGLFHDAGHLFHAEALDGAQAALARNELIAAFQGLAHHERLDQAHLPDGLRKLRDAFLIKGDARLVWAPVDGCNGDFRQLPAGVGRFCVLHKVEYGHRFVPPW